MTTPLEAMRLALEALEVEASEKLGADKTGE